jgi:hypothetical protein
MANPQPRHGCRSPTHHNRILCEQDRICPLLAQRLGKARNIAERKIPIASLQINPQNRLRAGPVRQPTGQPVQCQHALRPGARRLIPPKQRQKALSVKVTDEVVTSDLHDRVFLWSSDEKRIRQLHQIAPAARLMARWQDYPDVAATLADYAPQVLEYTQAEDTDDVARLRATRGQTMLAYMGDDPAETPQPNFIRRRAIGRGVALGGVARLDQTRSLKPP